MLASLIFIAALLMFADTASAANLCVSSAPGCSPTIQAAVDKAADGDTIALAAGEHAGGVTIDRSVTLRGAGAGRTVIRGGGPVLTIGTFGDATPPTVSVRRVTITGGVTRTSPVSTPFVEREGVWALGGGVHVPPGAEGAPGARVTIARSVVTGNRVAPAATVSSQKVECPDGDPCPFAYAGGGGIDTWGPLTLIDTIVSDNRAGTASGLSELASDAMGGGVLSHTGPLALRRVVVRDNAATASGPNGRFAEGGGVKAEAGRLEISRSRISGNRAALAAALPASVEQVAISGGLHITKAVGQARIVRTSLTGNAAVMSNRVGNSEAYGGAMNVEVGLDLVVRRTIISGNRAHASAARGDAEADSAGGTLLGTVARTLIARNRATAHAARGDAEAAAGGAFVFGRLVRTNLRGNSVRATAPRGTASVHGAGILVDEGPLTLRRTRVTGNRGTARGRTALGLGGGIFDDELFTKGGPLTLVHSLVSGNVLRGGKRAGGGIFTRWPTTLRDSRIRGNAPGQCDGC